MNKQTIITALLALVAMTSAVAQDLIKTATAPISLSKKNFADTIKIKVIDGAVVVPVEIEGQTRNLLFDTGSPLGLWHGHKEAWMKQITTDSLTFGDINKRSRNQIIYQFPTIKMGNLQIDNYPMIVENAMSEFICNRFDGVIGFNLVGKGLSFKLDTKDSLLIVTDRKKFFAEEEKGQPTAKYKMKRAYCPLVYVETPVGWIEMVFDTGAMNRWFDLPQADLDRWFQKNPKKRNLLDDLTIQTDTTINTSVGIYGMSTDTVVGRFLHFPAIKIDKLPVNDLYITTAHPTMLVGSAILKHVSLIIDAPRKQFVFVPHNGQKITVGNSEAGSVSFIPSEVGNTLGVLKAVVRKGSTAYQKGIRTGDYLIEVNGIPIKDICTYMLMERKDEEALFKFRSPDGIEKVVKLKRTN
jgi:Periplasmic protease